MNGLFEKVSMADEEDRQPPQAYDTVAPAGVGATTSNVMSPRAWQDLYLSGDQGLLDVAIEEMRSDLLYEFMESIPPADVIASWPDVDGAPPVQASSPAGVGSPGSQSFRSPQTTPESSGARTPATPPSVPLAAAGARTAAGAGGNGGGRGGGRGGRGGGGGGGGGRRGRRPRRIRGRGRNTPHVAFDTCLQSS